MTATRGKASKHHPTEGEAIGTGATTMVTIRHEGPDRCCTARKSEAEHERTCKRGLTLEGAMQVARERTWRGEVEQDEYHRSGKLRENDDRQEGAETWAKERDSLGCSKEK